MRSTATVDTQEKFDAWLAELGKPAATPGGGGGGGGAAPAEDGKAIFTSQDANCGACHTLADAGANGTIGPDLDTVLKGKDEAFIKQSIDDPRRRDRRRLPGRDHAAELRRTPWARPRSMRW